MHFLTRRRATALVATVAAIGGATVLASRPIASAAPPAVPTMAFVGGEGRLVDFNAAEVAKLAKAGRQTLDVSGSSGLADGKANVVVLDVTVLSPTAAGRVTLAPAVSGKGVSALAVTVPFGKGPNRTSRVAVPVGVKGLLSYGTTTGLRGLQVDVVGWAGPPSALGKDDAPVSLPPCRLVDTASGEGGVKGRINPNRGIAFPVLGAAQVPETPVKSVLYAVVVSDVTKKKSVLKVTGGPASTSLNIAPGKPQVFYTSLPGQQDLDVTLTISLGEANVALDALAFDDGSGDFAAAGPCDLVDDPGAPAATPINANLTPITVAPPSGSTPPAATTTVAAPTTTVAPTTTTSSIPPGTVITGTVLNNTTSTTTAGGTTTTTGSGSTSSSSSSSSSSTVASTAPPANRSFVDRPDEITGPQIHVIYMVAGDGVDRGYDADGTVAGSVLSFQNWLSGQIGNRRMKIDTFGGVPDVTFRRMSFGEQSLASTGNLQTYWMIQDLKSAGLYDTSKYYLVYYDGLSTFACGGASHPPDLGGHIAAVFLKANPVNGRSCAGISLSTGSPGYFEFVALHEVFHMMGLVAGVGGSGCKAGVSGDGHLSNVNDLMYGGSGAWNPTGIDTANQFYYKVTTPGCLDLDKSALVTGAGPGAWLPPEGPEGGSVQGDHEE